MARPVAGVSVEGKDKTAPLSVDGVNRAVYINHTVYEDKPMTFQLDTTGIINGPFNVTGYLCWDDLSPFMQGYTEPVLREAGAAFHMLAPETLERIIADCDYAIGVERFHDRNVNHSADEGAALWRKRQSPLSGGTPEPAYGLPPLTIQLCDDGKVRFA